MAISYVSGAAAAATSVAMPTHQAGDMIIVYAFRDGNTTAPTIAAGFTGLNPAGSNACSFTVGFKVAASGSETSGTWTNATSIAVAVYRNASTETWTTPVAYTKAGTGTSVDYSISGASFFGARYTLPQANTEVWHVRAAGHTTATDLASTTPSGWTARVAGGDARIIDSNGPSSTSPDSVGTNTQTVNASSGWTTVNIRLESWDGTGIVCMGADSTSGTAADLMPWHKAGDAIIGFSARANNTPPTLPAGYTNLGSAGANTHSAIVAYKVAASSSETNPVFTNGTNTLVTVYRSSRGSFNSLDVGNTNEGLSTTVDWANTSVSPVLNQTTKFIRFATFNGTGFMAIPVNWTSRADWGTPNPGIEVIDADGTTNAENIGGNTSTLGASMAWRTMTARLSYKPFDYENVNLNDQPVPNDVAGCYLTLIGGGGGGGTGYGQAFANAVGGGGGGGGASVLRSFIPVSKLSGTYSLSLGSGGGSTTDGGSSTFTSGSVSITAGGGGGGQAGGLNTGGAAGVGGVISASGVTVSGVNGTDGGAGGNSVVGSPAANNTSGSAPGGGGGGGRTSGGTIRAGGKGGDTPFAAGGAGATSSNGAGVAGGSASAGRPGGGGGGGAGSNATGSSAASGGNGGVYGAGAGGGGAGNVVSTGGTGASGYALIEWVTVAREENQNVVSAPIPENVTGCYVTMTGGGGAGGGGATRGGTGSGNGGGGGGGGAYVRRVWIPVSALGSTYSVTQGLGGAAVTQGNPGSAGGDSIFASGSTTITAGGGGGGQTATTPTGGAGGTVSIGSFTADSTENGATGGSGSTTGGVAGSAGGNSTDAGAGGGGGGSNKSSASAGGVGGSSAAVTGGTAGAPNGGGGGNATDAALGVGGAGGGGGAANAGFGTNGGGGGNGGLTGGGGGGGGGKEGASGTAGPGRPGASGYTLVEWVTTNPSQFFAAYGFF